MAKIMVNRIQNKVGLPHGIVAGITPGQTPIGGGVQPPFARGTKHDIHPTPTMKWVDSQVAEHENPMASGTKPPEMRPGSGPRKKGIAVLPD